jgi:hypothetical protein
MNVLWGFVLGGWRTREIGVMPSPEARRSLILVSCPSEWGLPAGCIKITPFWGVYRAVIPG